MGPPPNDALNNLLATLVEKHQVEVVPNPHRDGNWSRLLEEWNTTTGQNIKDGVIISRKRTNLKQQIKKKMSREIQYVINNAEDSSNSSITTNNISSITDPPSASGRAITIFLKIWGPSVYAVSYTHLTLPTILLV